MMVPSYAVGHRIFRELANGFFDFRVVHPERLQYEGGALIVSNHVSFLDPPLIGQAFDRPIHFFARKTLFSNPLVGALLRSWQAIPIDRDRPDPSSLKTTIRLLRSGESVLMFPEGTRSSDGQLQSPEPGVGLFIAKAMVPVLPVRLFGTFEALPRNCFVPRPASVTLVVGEPWRADLDNAKERTGKALYQALADQAIGKIGELGLS